jgi:arylsulfatase A-like enzyme
MSRYMTSGTWRFIAAVFGLQLAFAVSTSAKAAQRNRPNILFLLADDQRFDTIRALGNKEILTPHLDKLVSTGTTFTRAYIMGGDNAAVCVPSRAMLLTGRTLFHAQPFVKGTTLPEIMRQSGYATFGTGKWHNPPEVYSRGFTAGSNVFFGGMSDHLKVPVNDFDPSGKYPKEEQHFAGNFSSELFSDAAIQFLRQHKGQEPFFIYLPYTAPHDPRMAPKQFRDLYRDEKIVLPKNFMAEHPFDNGEMNVRDEQLAPRPRPPEIIRKHIADYYAMISHLDAQIGRVLAALEESGQAGNTVIVFAADNGLAVGQHGLMGKQNVYEHSVHVPLIIAGPDIPKGKRIDAFVYLFDIFPTLCEVSGIPVPETVEGRSLVPVITGQKAALRNTLFFAYRNVQRAVRDDRYKLIEYFVGADGKGTRITQFFDLAGDPWETRDLATDSKHAENLGRLRKEIARWMKEVEDPGRLTIYD